MEPIRRPAGCRHVNRPSELPWVEAATYREKNLARERILPILSGFRDREARRGTMERGI